MSNKTTWVEVEGELFYPRIFEDNYDDSDQHERTQGQFNTVFIPKDGDLDKLRTAGFPEVSMGHPQIKTYEFAGGREGVKLKRPVVHPKAATEDWAVAMGGPPKVFDWTDEMYVDKTWDTIENGELGNGTKALVKVSIYKMTKDSTPTVRLEKVAVTEHVPYEPAELNDIGW